MTCEICGKSYDTRRQLTQHRRIHDESYHVTCDVCGKMFTSQNLLKKHARWHVRVPEEKCPICDQRFLYKGAVETHLVRDHGHERQYTCEVCGTQFIHQRHYRRHMTKHEKNPDKVYRTQTTRRGYVKKSGDYWDEKIILAGNASSKNSAVQQNPDHPHNRSRQLMLKSGNISPSPSQVHQRVIDTANIAATPPPLPKVPTMASLNPGAGILAAAAARSQIGSLYEPDTRNMSNGQGIFSRLGGPQARLNSLDDFMRSGSYADTTNLTLQEL